VALGVVLVLFARPLAIWLCLLPFGFTRNETTFIAWVGLRGAVSILLAILPLMHGLPDGQTMFNATFLIVLTSLMVQGWTVRPAARWLGLVLPPRYGPIERVELELPGSPNHELAVYHILEESPVARGSRVPRWARPALIVRGDHRLDVRSAGRLQPGDYVYIFASPHQLPLLDRLFASPVELTSDDRMFFGDFVLDPSAPLAEVAKVYDVPLAKEDQGLSVGELVSRELGETPELGDRFPYGPVELIVRSLDDEGGLAALGLALQPTAQAQPRLPFFQTRRDLAAYWRAWRSGEGKAEPIRQEKLPPEPSVLPAPGSEG
jgi:cell volume regulation protein A